MSLATNQEIAGLLDSNAAESEHSEEHPLSVEDVMSREIITASTEDNLDTAVKKITQNHVSCIFVMKGESVEGILTERDLTQGVGAGKKDLDAVLIAELMSSPVTKVPPDLPLLDAGAIMERQGIRRMLVAKDHRPAGIVTQTDIMRGLIFMNGVDDVSHIMSTDIATVGANQNVEEAARLMSARNISCVVVIQRDQPHGILTERDLLTRVLAARKDPEATAVVEVMSSPLTTVSFHCSVISASKLMDETHRRRLVVADGKRIRGIITQTDIMKALKSRLEKQREQNRCLKAEKSRNH